MPELPEVETVRRGLASAMEGRPIRRVHVMRPDLRIPFPDGFADRLTGRIVRRLARRAKYLLVECDDGTVLIVHLGMSGRMVIDPAGHDSADARLAPGGFVHNTMARGRHEHVVFELGDGILGTLAHGHDVVDLARGARSCGARLAAARGGAVCWGGAVTRARGVAGSR